MKPKPDDAFFCYIPNTEDAKTSLLTGKAFTPAYHKYLYFRRVNIISENVIEGYLGRLSEPEDYHSSITSQFDYFTRFRDGEPVYITFDGFSFFKIENIYTSTPLLFVLKKAKPFTSPGAAVTRTTHPLHFEDLSGTQFENLVYALVARMKSWDKLEWLGQVGADNGTDILGNLVGITYRYQCANHKTLSTRKIFYDIDKLAGSGIKTDHFIVVCGGTISNKARSSITGYALSRCSKYAEVWSGAELEEKLRKYGPEIIDRFFYHGQM